MTAVRARKKPKKRAKKRLIKRKSPLKKRPARKRVVKKKAAKKKRPAVQKSKEKPLGIVTHYFPHVRAAAIKLKAPLNLWDTIKIKGHTIQEHPIVYTERREGQSKMSKSLIFESALRPLQLRLETLFQK